MNAIPRKIPLPTKSGLDIIAIDRIIYLEADGAYVRIFLEDQTSIYISKAIKWFENHLSKQFDFCRIHNSYICNINYIEKYIKGDGGQVKMTDGKYLAVSRARKKSLLTALKNL